LHNRVNLARVYLLIDARHGLKRADDTILDALGQAGVSYQIVLTKSDQVGDAAIAECTKVINADMKKRPAAFAELIATSVRNRDGIDRLRAAIARLLGERG